MPNHTGYNHPHAARQFDIWIGERAPEDEMMQVVSLALQERATRAAAAAAKKK